MNLMPYNQGTAVDIRYTIVQALGARCNKHDSDMTSKVESILKMSAQDVQLNVDDFLNYKNQAHTTPTQVGGNNTKPTAKFCVNCGSQLSDETRFCSTCGQEVTAEAPVENLVSFLGKNGVLLHDFASGN